VRTSAQIVCPRVARTTVRDGEQDRAAGLTVRLADASDTAWYLAAKEDLLLQHDVEV
jgi:hypothetical protein